MDAGNATWRGNVALLVIGLAALACVLLSVDRGLELTDESSYIYLLHHPQVMMQFADHRLWGALGGSIVFYRVLPLMLTTASAALVASGATRALGLQRREARFVRLAALVGALGYFSVIRPTMNYGTTGLVFGNVFIGVLLHDLARPAGKRLLPLLPVLLGVALALLALGRFTAVPAYALILIGYAGLRPDGWATRLWLVVGTLVATAATLALLQLSGFALGDMLRFGSGLTNASHRLSEFVPRDLALIALVAGAGAVGAGGVTVAGRIGVPRAVAAGLFVTAVLLAGLADHRSVFLAPEPGVSPFATNVSLYGTTYAFYVLGAFLATLLALSDLREGREAWRRDARLWGVLLLLALACGTPFVGTNTGILARSGLNAGPLFAAVAIAALACGDRGLLGGTVGRGLVVGMAALGAVFVFLNTLWSPYGVNGGWQRQTTRLEAPAAVRGLRVSPATAVLARDLRGGLARLGFDPAQDRLLFGYAKPGLAVLAGGEVAGLPFAGNDPRSTPGLCAQIARSIAAERPRRVYGLNLDYRAPLIDCLAGAGIDLRRAPRHRISPLVTITVVSPGLR